MNSNMQKKGIHACIYFEPEKIADDEVFKFMNDDVVDNIVPERYLISNYGRVYDTFSDRLIAINYDRKGLKKDGTPKGYQYCKIKYRNDDDIIDSKRVRVNRAVAITFDKPDNFNELEVNHMDGDHSNNKLSNLEWNTKEENRRHAYENRLYVNGQDHPCAHLTNKQAESICDMLMEGKTNIEISRITNVDPDIISGIRNKTAYRYIAENYQFPILNPETPDELVIQAAEMISRGISFREIEEITGIGKSRLGKIKAHQYKPELTKNYNFDICIDPEKLQQIKQICEELEKGNPPAIVSKKLGIAKPIISGIASGHAYSYISKDYNIPSFRHDLDREIVKQICDIIMTDTKSYSQIARDFGISVGIVQDIHSKKVFKDITSSYNFPPSHQPGEIPENIVRVICSKLQDGETSISISNELGIPVSKIYHIKYRDTHQDISKDYIW